jgi:hypothetical protein
VGKRNLMQVLNEQVAIIYQEGVRRALVSCELSGADQIENLEIPPMGGSLTPHVFNDSLRETLSKIAPLT